MLTLTERRGAAGAALRYAKRLLDNGDGWTQGTAARDRDGNPVSPRANSSMRFCLRGAVALACFETVEEEFDRDDIHLSLSILLDKVAWALYVRTATAVNDKLGYEATAKVLDNAIGMFEESCG